MGKLKQTGTKISQYPIAEINTGVYKKMLNHYHHILTYAPSNYGSSTINKNYQIPIDVLRDDTKGYIGLDNIKGNWRNYLSFWQGYWSDSTDNTNSYVYEWDDALYNHPDYIKNKHGLEVEEDVSRVFILNTAPWPLEATDSNVNSLSNKTFGADPNPRTLKIVDKNYVDNRHNGFRKVNKSGSVLEIRPYTCFYQYSNLPEKHDNTYCIDIRDSQIMEDGKTIKGLIGHNRLFFYIIITNHNEFYYKEKTNDDGETVKYHANNLKILVNGEPANWSYEDELTEILRESRPKGIHDSATNNIFIRCEAEYINNKFTVTCSNFFGHRKVVKRITHVDVPVSGIVPELDLSLHENESFVMQIPQREGTTGEQGLQTVVTFNASYLNDFHEYVWNFYVITPDKTIGSSSNENSKDFDDVIFDNGTTPVMWAMEDGFNIQPKLEPNMMYCFEFSKVFDNLLIGRIKYHVSLIKKS